MRSDQTWSRVTMEALPVVAKANPDLRHRHAEPLVAGAFGQGDIDYLGVENGSPADDHDRGAALVVRQTGSRSTGLPSAGCATARPRSSSRFGGRSFTRWVITSESTTPRWASSDGNSAVSIPLVSDVRTAQPITRVGYPPTGRRGPSERYV